MGDIFIFLMLAFALILIVGTTVFLLIKLFNTPASPDDCKGDDDDVPIMFIP
jgi:hypothetical protein